MDWRTTKWLPTFSLAMALLACEAPSAPPDRVSAGAEETVTIHVTSNGWHTGIVVARADLPAGAVPEAADFPEARYLSFGWGDAEYYPAAKPSFTMALGAALRPTPAVVHLAGLRAPPGEVFPSAEIVELRLSTNGFRLLVDYLEASFARDGAARVEASGPGLYGFSRFYPATGEFHLFNTCNTWTARGLRAAGWPIDLSSATSAEDVMAQLRD
jgi:uncharacterized protein (TIGR02117 family)